MRNAFLCIFSCLLLIALSACNPLKKLGQGKLFLNRNIVHSDSLRLTKEEIASVLKQKPNRKILGVMRLHLGMYYLGSVGDTTVKGHHFIAKFWKKIKRGMRQIGEEPVFVDSALTGKSRRQLLTFVQRKGFFDAQVTDTIIALNVPKIEAIKNLPLGIGRTGKANVIYRIRAAQPYKIRDVFFSSQDPDISNILSNIKANSLIKPGTRYDEDILDKERDRITSEIRNSGMYYFNRNYITYGNDSMLGTHQVDIYLYVNRQFENTAVSESAAREPENHHRYHLNNIYVLTNYETTEKPEAHTDTTFYNGYYFITDRNNDYIKRDALLRAVFMKSGDQFYQPDVDYTLSRLFDLNLFRFINFRFKEVPRDSIQNNYLLDVYIQMSPLAKYGYKAEVEGTNNGGNLGASGSLSFQNKNLFRAAGTLEVKISGGLERLQNFGDSVQTKNLFFGLFNTYDIGPEVSLGFKKFLLPGFIEGKTSRYFNPKTVLSAGFNYQTRPDYTRLITRFNFGYQWRIKTLQRLALYPFEVNAINVTLDPQFNNKLKETHDPNLIYSYQNHLITSVRFVYELINQTPHKEKDFFYLRTNIETAGNSIYLLSSVLKLKKDTSDKYLLFGNIYSQFFKPDLDVSYHQILNPANSMVYRVNLGYGFTYGNSSDQLLPFDKAFFVGGANDIRAWLARTLGPGSYRDTLNIENGGDIKMEANAEYRSAIFKVLETALFVDAGNVWLRKDPSGTLQSGIFRTSTFLNQVAVGAGFGLRFNFTFFIIRVDFGVKLRDPAALGDKWVYSTQKLGDVVPNFAIGYPF